MRATKTGFAATIKPPAQFGAKQWCPGGGHVRIWRNGPGKLSKVIARGAFTVTVGAGQSAPGPQPPVPVKVTLLGGSTLTASASGRPDRSGQLTGTLRGSIPSRFAPNTDIAVGNFSGALTPFLFGADPLCPGFTPPTSIDSVSTSKMTLLASGQAQFDLVLNDVGLADLRLRPRGPARRDDDAAAGRQGRPGRAAEAQHHRQRRRHRPARRLAGRPRREPRPERRPLGQGMNERRLTRRRVRPDARPGRRRARRDGRARAAGLPRRRADAQDAGHRHLARPGERPRERPLRDQRRRRPAEQHEARVLARRVEGRAARRSRPPRHRDPAAHRRPGRDPQVVSRAPRRSIIAPCPRRRAGRPSRARRSRSTARKGELPPGPRNTPAAIRLLAGSTITVGAAGHADRSAPVNGVLRGVIPSPFRLNQDISITGTEGSLVPGRAAGRPALPGNEPAVQPARHAEHGVAVEVRARDAEPHARRQPVAADRLRPRRRGSPARRRSRSPGRPARAGCSR